MKHPTSARPKATLSILIASLLALPILALAAPGDVTAVLSKYKHLDPKRLVAKTLSKKAILYFDTNITSFTNEDFLGVVDFSIKSNPAR